MSHVTVRPLEPRDEAGFEVVMSLTYNDGKPIERIGDWTVNREAYVAVLEGQIVGGFSVLPLTANRGTARLACGGLAAVGVAPDARRSGVGGAMMRWYVNEANRQGVPLASLYAFREPFYRKAGYEVAGRRLRVYCPTPRLPYVQSDLPVRRLGPADWRELEPCYRAFAQPRSGLNLREEEWQWKRVLGEHRPLTVYAFGDPIEAYAVIAHSTAFWTDQHVSELIWSSRSGYEAALAFLRQLGMNKNGMSWYEPSDGPFYSRYMDQGVEVKVDRPIMFRINSVPAALRALQPDGEGEFSVGILDDVVAANHRSWRVRFGSGGVEVEEGGEPDFTIDIRHFAQAFMGEPSLAELLRSDLVSVHRAGPVGDALRLLTPSSTICHDFF